MEIANPTGVLARLGFTKKGEPRGTTGADYELTLDPTQSAAENVEYIPPLRFPCFFVIKGVIETTVAIDETGQGWILRGQALDLKPYGFMAAFESQTKH